MAATIKARLQDVWRELGMVQSTWMSAIETMGKSYAEAYRLHVRNLPTQLPPDEHAKLIGKVVSGVTGLGVSAVLNPLAATIVFTPIGDGIEKIAESIGSHIKPKTMHVPICDTPQAYQNTYKIFIRDGLANMARCVDQIIDVVDGIREAKREVTHEHVDTLIYLCNMSPLLYPPDGYAAWNNNKRLDLEMERCMWVEWCMQMTQSKKLVEAADLDIAKSLKRMQQLGLVSKRITADGGFKVRLSAAIVMVKGAKRYRPQIFGKKMSDAARRYAQRVVSLCKSGSIGSKTVCETARIVAPVTIP